MQSKRWLLLIGAVVLFGGRSSGMGALTPQNAYKQIVARWLSMMLKYFKVTSASPAMVQALKRHAQSFAAAQGDNVDPMFLGLIDPNDVISPLGNLRVDLLFAWALCRGDIPPAMQTRILQAATNPQNVKLNYASALRIAMVTPKLVQNNLPTELIEEGGKLVNAVAVSNPELGPDPVLVDDPVVGSTPVLVPVVTGGGGVSMPSAPVTVPVAGGR